MRTHPYLHRCYSDSEPMPVSIAVVVVVVVVVVVCNFLQCLKNFTIVNKCPYFKLLTFNLHPPILRNVYFNSFKNLVRLQCRA